MSPMHTNVCSFDSRFCSGVATSEGIAKITYSSPTAKGHCHFELSDHTDTSVPAVAPLKTRDTANVTRRSSPTATFFFTRPMNSAVAVSTCCATVRGEHESAWARRGDATKRSAVRRTHGSACRARDRIALDPSRRGLACARAGGGRARALESGKNAGLSRP